MRIGISFSLSSLNRQQLRAIVANPKGPQKHVWRARIVLLSGEVGAPWRSSTRFVRESNANSPKPFSGKANPDDIIAARNRGLP